jgi:hypothetical protein
MKHLLLVIIVCCFALSCEKITVDDEDLLGEWLVLRACDSCVIYEFKKNNILDIKEIGRSGDIYSTEYRLFRDRTIQLEYYETKGRYDIVLHSIDTVEILGFSISSLPMEMNTLLKRMHYY